MPSSENGAIDLDQDLMQTVVSLINREVSIDQVERNECFVAEDGTVGLIVDQRTFDAIA